MLDTDGRQHVLLRSGGISTQVIIGGCSTVIDEVALGLRICRPSDVGAIGKELAALGRLLSGARKHSGDQAQWTAETMRRRDALIALDSHRAGASLREIAIAIYGLERVEREWPGRGLRSRVRRALRRGEALCSGGYRTLLD